MKPESFTFAVIADQISSRETTDAVPQALAALARLEVELPFERTAGDEIQALIAHPRAVVDCILLLTRLSDWRIGVGVGTVQQPLPSSTRAARGPAYFAARDAVAAARRQPTGFALRLPDTVSGPGYRELDDSAQDAETAIWLWRGLISRRSQEGWELMDLLDAGLSNAEAARRLNITPSAVSQRLSAAAREEGHRGAALATRLLGRLQSYPERETS
jgi:Winged helix-turn-helix DNA-binding